MKIATTHLLTAFYSLSHRIALTAEDVAELERDAPCLSPELWQATRQLLADADRGEVGTTLDLGFVALVLRWLGLADEAAFGAEFGVGVVEALGRDLGRLGEVAGALESPGAPGDEALGVQLALSWSRRGVCLMQAHRRAAAPAVEALGHAVAHYPWADTQYRQLMVSFVLACEAAGDWERQAIGYRQIQDFDREVESRAELAEVHTTAALVLSILWCVAHDDFLLADERGIEPWIHPSPEVWARLCTSVAVGDLGGVPIPLLTYARWTGTGDDSVDSEALRRALAAAAGAGLLAEMRRAIERLWDGPPGERLASSPAVTYVQAAARLRRARLEQTWVAVPGERRNIYCEVHQGMRRPATLERLELIHRMHALFLRCALDDPIVVASVWLDRAAEAESGGEHEGERVALLRAMELMRAEVHDPAVREYAVVCYASWLWRQGDVDEARGRLLRLEGRQARDLRALVDAREPEREMLREAERRLGEGDLESSCEVALAHVRAGHSARAEQLACELCRVHRDEPLAWLTLAKLLFETGRYRDAAGPALRAVDIGVTGAVGKVLLARIFSRMGPDGRARGGAVALGLIEAHPTEAQLEREELADLVRIAEDGGAPLWACRRGDDHVSSLGPDADAPPEWLGEAAARRCHGVWGPDAPAWLARLAAGAAPAELARFVVERFEALLYWRLIVARTVFGAIPDLETERRLYSRAWALGEGMHEICLDTEVSDAVRRAGAALGWAPSAEPVEPAVHWEPHFAAIQAVFGVDGVIRLRASEGAQRSFFSEFELMEPDRLVVFATFEAERFFWVRWVGQNRALLAPAAGQEGCSAGTLERLQPLLDLAVDGSFESVSKAAWLTRWHEGERE